MVVVLKPVCVKNMVVQEGDSKNVKSGPNGDAKN